MLICYDSNSEIDEDGCCWTVCELFLCWTVVVGRCSCLQNCGLC
jgi:hypothetical protein